jgi:hypothetical protein
MIVLLISACAPDDATLVAEASCGPVQECGTGDEWTSANGRSYQWCSRCDEATDRCIVFLLGDDGSVNDRCDLKNPFACWGLDADFCDWVDS